MATETPSGKSKVETSHGELEGKVTYGPRDLQITWGNDPRYWKLRDSNMKYDDRDNFAELKQVCWLEVTGSTKENLKDGKSYKVSFKVSLKEDAFGWDDCNVYIMAKIGKKGKFNFKQVNLKEQVTSVGDPFDIPKDDNALKIKVEPLKNNNNTDNSRDLKLYFGLYEVWSRKWKGGLRIYHAFVEEIEDEKK